MSDKESIKRVKEYLKNYKKKKEDFEAILNILNGYIESKSDKEIETSDKDVENIKIVIKDCREHLKLYGEAFITANELDRIEHIL